MAKALKIAGIVVGVAALAVVTGGAALGFGVSLGTSIAGIGISAGGLLAISSGLTLAAGLLTKAPSVPSSQTQRLIASIDPRAFRKTVLGQTAMATDIRYEEWSGTNQEYCDWIVCLASHAIDGVDEIWIDQELAWSASRGVSAKFAGYFWVPNIVLEGSPTNTFTFGSGLWNGSTRLTGCAYLRLRFKTTRNGKKATSPFSSGISTRLTIIGRGAKLYDPRRDSTVPGGSGPMRWNDQSTWRYTADDGTVIGENLALQILRVVLGWRIRNPASGEWRLATGSGVPGRRIGMTSFQIAANLCDELVNRSAGGQEPRYHGAGVISEGDDPKTVLDMLCAACCGRFRDTGGKLELAIAHNDLAAAAADDGLTDDDVIGAFTWDPDPSLEATPNVIRGRYVDATAASLYQLLDYPEVRLPSPDGQDRIATLDLGVVESPSQAQRIVRQVLQRKQYQRTFSAPFDIRAWKYGVGDVLPFTFAPLGFTRALFRVADQEQGQGGTCQMTLTVEHQSIYAWDANDAAAVQAADPIIYDRGNNPLILAIEEASESALWSGVADDDGNRPENGATVGAPPGTSVGGRPVEEVIAQLDRIDPIEAQFGPITSDISVLQQVQLGHDDALSQLADVTADQGAAQRQITRDVGRMDEALLRALMESARTRDVLRDAGIVVDPTTGQVRIYAIDQLRDRTSTAEIAIDAVKSVVTTKASVNQVQELIAQAVLDPSQVAELEPIIARLTSAESEIDGLNAAVALKASLVEVTAIGGRTSNVEQTLDALAGEVSSKASTTAVDELGIRLGSAEQMLSTLPDVSGYSVTVRQARVAADDAAEAALRGMLAGDMASRYQLSQIAEARQELTTKLVDGFTAEAIARTALTAQIGQIRASVLSEAQASVTRDSLLTQRLDAQGGVLDNQAAAISEARKVALDAQGGVASAQMTIRQQIVAADSSDEALLRALVAGDQADRARIAQAVQIQTEFTTTLVENERAAAVARQALLARMSAADAAIVATSKVAADANQATAERVNALEVAFNDAATGLLDTRARIVSLEDAVATRNAAFAEQIELIEATVGGQADGLAAISATVAEDRQASVTRDEANAQDIQQVSAQVNNPETGLPKAFARIDQERNTRVAEKAVTASALQSVSARIDDLDVDLDAIAADIVWLAQAQADGDGANAELIQQVRARLDSIGGVSIEQKFEALVEATGRILGTVTVAIDSDRNMVGTQLIGSPEGRGTFNLINADFRMGTGRIILNTGTTMLVIGVGFGAHRDLILWYGPTMAIDQCSRANSQMYLPMFGEAYFGGGLSAGTLKNPGESSSLAADAVAAVSPFGSNGKPVKYVASWSYRREWSRTYPADAAGVSAFNADVAYFGATGDGYEYSGMRVGDRPPSSVTLSRSFDGAAFTQLDQRVFSTETSTMTGFRPVVGDAPGRADFSSVVGGGFTVTDPIQSVAPRSLRLVLSRGFEHPSDTINQRLSIVAVEE